MHIPRHVRYPITCYILLIDCLLGAYAMGNPWDQWGWDPEGVAWAGPGSRAAASRSPGFWPRVHRSHGSPQGNRQGNIKPL